MSKIRTDFVTNSSSSSYVCEICGAEEYSYDIPDLHYCKDNEHLVCKDHLIDGKCPICTLDAYSQSEMASYLLKTKKISRDEVFAEIKKVNKRRRKLYDVEYIKYVFDKFNLTEEKIMNEIKSNYGSYSNYIEFIWRNDI